MKHILLFLASFVLGVATYGQGYSLSCYIKAAKQYSPLLYDYRHQLQIEQAELRRLKALYTRSRLERTVTEQFLLCLLDQTQIAFADSIDALLKRQTSLVRQLA